MKKLLLMIVAFSGITVFAQKNNVESAAIYLRNTEMEDAKKMIDMAAVHDETKDDPKMWFYRAAIYDTISRNPQFAGLDKDAVEKFTVATQKCIETDTKKRYEYYTDIAVVNSAFASYNKAIDAIVNKDPANAYKFFQYVLNAIKYDKNSDLKKNNINEKQILLQLADLGMKTGNNQAALSNLQKLIDMDYQDPIVYLLVANIHLEAKDTAKAMSYIEQARTKFPSDKDAINMELNIYLSQGKLETLLKKLDEALEQRPDNEILLFVRGNVYDNYATNATRTAKHLRDTAEKVSRKAKAATPANKPKMDAAVKSFNKQADSLTAMNKTYVAQAEADYKKVLELKDDYIDAYFNLGALTNNKTDEIVEKMNNVPTTNQADYDRKWGALKKERDALLNESIGYFSKALTVAESLPDQEQDQKKYKNETIYSVLDIMQRLYAQLGDMKKYEEMKQRKTEYQ